MSILVSEPYLLRLKVQNALTMKEKLKPYVRFFSEKKFWRKLQKFGRKAGIKVIYSALLLFYAYRRKDTPTWAKTIVLGVLGYFITPIDFIPDLSPILGYTDDLGWLTFGLVTVAGYINEDVRGRARAKLGDWFGDYAPEELEPVDKHL